MRNPFEDTRLVQGDLYAGPERMATRTEVLLDAKVGGEPPVDRMAEIVRKHLRAEHPFVVDIGPGLGESTLRLQQELAPAQLVAIDIAPAMLAAVHDKLGDQVTLIEGDFHALPLPEKCADLAVLMFCVYHSSEPHTVLQQVHRILKPGGLAVFATKGPRSYRSMDELVRHAGLDDRPVNQPSLYRTFNADNFLEIVGSSLRVIDAHYVDNRFVFRRASDLARYVATSPRYSTYRRIPTHEIEAQLTAAWPPGAFVTTSTLAYCAAIRET